MKKVDLPELQPRKWEPLPKYRKCCNSKESHHHFVSCDNYHIERLKSTDIKYTLYTLSSSPSGYVKVEFNGGIFAVPYYS